MSAAAKERWLAIRRDYEANEKATAEAHRAVRDAEEAQRVAMSKGESLESTARGLSEAHYALRQLEEVGRELARQVRASNATAVSSKDAAVARDHLLAQRDAAPDPMSQAAHDEATTGAVLAFDARATEQAPTPAAPNPEVAAAQGHAKLAFAKLSETNPMAAASYLERNAHLVYPETPR